MRIAAFSLHGNRGWTDLGLEALDPGLNVFHGPSASGKTSVADLVAQTLYGRRLPTQHDAELTVAPDGEVIVENRDRQYRLRRSHDETAGVRLTVAALDHSAVDQDTVRQLVACLSPSLLRPLFAVSFRESPQLDWLLSAEFSQEYRAALWRLKWAPPSVSAEMRPIYARLRALEARVASLVRGLSSEEARDLAAAKSRAKMRNRRASHFLAQFTDGELLRLRLGTSSGEAHVATRAGDSQAVESLWSTQRDQVYLSLCLALVSALGRHGIRLPLVLDEPFARMDARSSAALVAVLDDFSRHGNQVLVFTAQQEATERFAALGAAIHDMRGLQCGVGEPALAVVSPAKTQADEDTRRAQSGRKKRREAG